MFTDSFDKKICQAIRVIVDKAIQKAGYNKTIKGQIVGIIDNNIGKYRIKYQDMTFIAFSSSIDNKYQIGDIVYIIFPNNDDDTFNKIILTKAR